MGLEEAVDEAKGFKTKVSAKGRLDLTKLECVTIDPETAKDFDDAISLTTDEANHYHLGVHIADVAAYVKFGSHLDLDAYLHCNSTYFPGFCLPMLPEELSNELCSLKPNVNRLTVSVLAEFDPTGRLVKYTINDPASKAVNDSPTRKPTRFSKRRVQVPTPLFWSEWSSYASCSNGNASEGQY